MMPLDRTEFGNISLYPGLNKIASELERVLGASYVDAVQTILKNWQDIGPGISPTEARHVVEQVLRDWPELAAAQYAEVIDRIFGVGFMVGVLDTGVITGPDHGDQMTMEWLKNNRRGFVPSLRYFTDGERRWFEKVIADAYRGRDRVTGRAQPFDLDEMVKRVEERTQEVGYKVERVIRTETAKATALGRIAAWENDPMRDFYDYFWVPTHDRRTKDVSLLFERHNPYDFNGIKKVWTVDHNEPQLVINRHTGRQERQTSAFNCRCTPARAPKDPDQLLNEGLISREEHAALLAA